MYIRKYSNNDGKKTIILRSSRKKSCDAKYC